MSSIKILELEVQFEELTSDKSNSIEGGCVEEFLDNFYDALNNNREDIPLIIESYLQCLATTGDGAEIR